MLADRGRPRRILQALTAALALGAVSGSVWCAADPVQPQAPTLQFVPPPPGSYALQRIQRVPDALLRDARDRPRRLATLARGRVTLLTFFYTYCVDEWGCPFAFRTMTELRQALVQRGHAGRVRFISISFDPAHDTPDALRLYSAGVRGDAGLRWEFLTARSVDELLPLLADLGQDVRVETDERGRPTRTINHMLKLFLADAEGFVREIYTLDYLHPSMLMNDIETLLIEQSAGRGPAR